MEKRKLRCLHSSTTHLPLLALRRSLSHKHPMTHQSIFYAGKVRPDVDQYQHRQPSGHLCVFPSACGMSRFEFEFCTQCNWDAVRVEQLSKASHWPMSPSSFLLLCGTRPHAKARRQGSQTLLWKLCPTVARHPLRSGYKRSWCCFQFSRDSK